MDLLHASYVWEKEMATRSLVSEFHGSTLLGAAYWSTTFTKD